MKWLQTINQNAFETEWVSVRILLEQSEITRLEAIYPSMRSQGADLDFWAPVFLNNSI